MKIFIWVWQEYKLQTIGSSVAQARLNILEKFSLTKDFEKYKQHKANIDLFDVLLTEPEIVEEQCLFYIDLSEEWK